MLSHGTDGSMGRKRCCLMRHGRFRIGGGSTMRLRAPARQARSGIARAELLHEPFADPWASAIFEELAREVERMGMRVDRHYFATRFGGRAVVVGACSSSL